jgi:hypothetical protein
VKTVKKAFFLLSRECGNSSVFTEIHENLLQGTNSSKYVNFRENHFFRENLNISFFVKIIAEILQISSKISKVLGSTAHISLYTYHIFVTKIFASAYFRENPPK